MKNESIQFALCLNNEGYPASLEVGKLYRVVADKEALREGYLRVVDESGEDYAFSASRFHIVELPLAVRKTLTSFLHKPRCRCSPAATLQNLCIPLHFFTNINGNSKPCIIYEQAGR